VRVSICSLSVIIGLDVLRGRAIWCVTLKELVLRVSESGELSLREWKCKLTLKTAQYSSPCLPLHIRIVTRLHCPTCPDCFYICRYSDQAANCMVQVHIQVGQDLFEGSPRLLFYYSGVGSWLYNDRASC